MTCLEWLSSYLHEGYNIEPVHSNGTAQASPVRREALEIVKALREVQNVQF